MQFKQDESVVMPNGQVVGHVDRVVMNPQNKQITHIVVRKGFFFTEDKLVPLSLIETATEDRVTLRRDAGDLDKLPAFEDTHYIPLTDPEAKSAAYTSDLASPLYWYPPLGGWMAYDYPPPYVVETERHIPEDTVPLREGARVISADDKHVGNVERVFTEANADRATYFLISKGLFLKERKLVPTTWVREVSEDEVRLSVDSSVLETLHEYQEA
jgi:uncharacterized protein YrrD